MTRIIKQGFFHYGFDTINVIEVQTDKPFNEGVVYNAEEDVYTIVLNYQVCPKKKKELFEHAMRHINKEDFFKNDVQQIEKDAHQKEPPFEGSF